MRLERLVESVWLAIMVMVCSGCTTTKAIEAGSRAQDGGGARDADPNDATSSHIDVQRDAGNLRPARDPRCPVMVPEERSPCTSIVTCEYGGDAHHDCTTSATCASDGSEAPVWHTYSPAAGCGVNSGGCPATFGALKEGSACPGDQVLCDYDEGRCGCIGCGASATGPTGSVWSCRKWDSGGDGCPPISPLLGDACQTPDKFCTYNGCGISVGVSMQCSTGYWRPVANTALACRTLSCDGGT